MQHTVLRFIHEETAAVFAEYAIVLVMVALAVIAVVVLFRDAINNALQSLVVEWERVQRQ